VVNVTDGRRPDRYIDPASSVIIAVNVFAVARWVAVDQYRVWSKMSKKKYTFDIGNSRLLTIAKKYDQLCIE